MLTEMRIRNFTVMEELTVRLEPGLNVITGETGAGKTILVDALGMLLGGRARTEVIRSGEQRAVVEGVMDTSGLASVVEWLDEVGLEGDDGQLLIRRELRQEGRSRAWVNGSPVTVATLRTLGEQLVDIHGQHEHQRLLSSAFQREVLDAFGGCEALLAQTADAYKKAEALRQRLGVLRERQQELTAQSDFIRYQLEEIERAELREGEEEELGREVARLAHADELARESRALYDQLYGGDGAVTDRLAESEARIRRLAEIDPSLKPGHSALTDAYHRVADLATELADYASAIDADPARLRRLQDRQATLHTLKRKYGATVAEVIATGESLALDLAELDAADADLGSLTDDLARADADWQAAATQLSARRHTAGERLAAQAQELFPGLGLDGGRFAVRFEERAEPSPTGQEHVRFEASMNPGFPLGPLARIASGGELSRVMLVLKSVLSGVDDLATMVFDEIDAGIGGAVAAKVSEQMSKVANGRQVLAVTHLARIASRASVHLFVEKNVAGGKATTTLRRLSQEERVRELARMLGGDPDSESSLNHARELLGA